MCGVHIQTVSGISVILIFFEVFWKFGLLNRLCWRPPSFVPCRILVLISCIFVMMHSRSHVDFTWICVSKSPSNRPCMHLHSYVLFLQTWDAFLDVWDSHIDVNWHLDDTWIILVFLKSWNTEPPLITASLFFSLQNPCSCILRLGCDV